MGVKAPTHKLFCKPAQCPLTPARLNLIAGNMQHQKSQDDCCMLVLQQWEAVHILFWGAS